MRPRIVDAVLPRMETAGFKHRWVFCTLVIAGTLIAFPTHAQLTLLAWSQALSLVEWMIGFGLLLFGVAIRFWATLHIGGCKSKRLVQTGPYSVCRNPLYIANIAILLSVGVMLRQPAFLGAAALIACYYHFLVVRYEERRLIERLGEDYLRYRQAVPIWFPNWSLYREEKLMTLKTTSLQAEARRTACWIWFPFLLIAFRLAG